jgi:cysteine synthase A
MKIARSIVDLIGRTPLLELTNYEKDHELQATVLGKLECMNPAGSAKDRAAISMIEDAEAKGHLRPKATIIEPTSGNTGIALAAVGAARGYHVVLVMPDSMSQERRALAEAYGAELVLTPGAKGMAGAVEQAKIMNMFVSHSIIAGQFDNPANPEAHYKTTGPEIWEDTDGKVDLFVAGVGTGGTISGAGRYLKEKNPNVKIIAVEPASSPLLSQGKTGPHGLQGIGPNFVPENLDRKLLDEIVTVEDEVAFNACRELAQRDGILAGITSGAAVWAAGELAKRPENQGKTIVALLPDTGTRYLSTPVFSENRLL